MSSSTRAPPCWAWRARDSPTTPGRGGLHMPRYDFDLFTIGGGSGGVAASRRAGALGARVGLCEVQEVGGTCVHRGCIPKKLLVYASHFHHDFEDAAGFGWSVPSPTFDWSALQAA